MNITVRIKEQYGHIAIYPVCKAAKTFALIAGTKTLTPSTIECVKSLGYSVTVEQKELTL
jgi:hypothetical protein